MNFVNIGYVDVHLFSLNYNALYKNDSALFLTLILLYIGTKAWRKVAPCL